MAGATGLEPATFGVTGRRSNQLNYAPAWAGDREPVPKESGVVSGEDAASKACELLFRQRNFARSGRLAGPGRPLSLYTVAFEGAGSIIDFD